MRDWKNVYFDNKEHRVDIITAILDDRGLSPVKVNKKNSQYNFGYFEIFVAPEHVIQATKIIKEEIQFE